LSRFDKFEHLQDPRTMKKLWMALTFLAGGLAHELRNPLSCQCIPSRPAAVWRAGREQG
jgi:nitrogen-specific signal transduction histidine kinase